MVQLPKNRKNADNLPPVADKNQWQGACLRIKPSLFLFFVFVFAAYQDIIFAIAAFYFNVHGNLVKNTGCARLLISIFNFALTIGNCATHDIIAKVFALYIKAYP